MPNVVKIGQSVAKVLRFFDFSRCRPPPSCVFEIVNFYLLTVSGGIRRITVPDIVKIVRYFAEILRKAVQNCYSWIFNVRLHVHLKINV